jgi:hypothetical protein
LSKHKIKYFTSIIASMEVEIEYPSKNYPTKSGTWLSSPEYAEVLKEAIEHYNNQIKSTKDKRKIKKLQDKLRSIKIWISQHDDVHQFIK